MNIFKNWLSALIVLLIVSNVKAYIPIGSHGKPLPNVAADPKANNRDQCTTAKSQTDMEINNVRARLQGGGDIWWDFRDARYVVPKVAPGVTPVSSIFAGGVWIGGRDAGGNLKTACTTYRTSGNDWFPGPLDFTTGSTDAKVCANWDKHFRVLGADINKARAAYAVAEKDANG